MILNTFYLLVARFEKIFKLTKTYMSKHLDEIHRYSKSYVIDEKTKTEYETEYSWFTKNLLLIRES